MKRLPFDLTCKTEMHDEVGHPTFTILLQEDGGQHGGVAEDDHEEEDP